MFVGSKSGFASDISLVAVGITTIESEGYKNSITGLKGRYGFKKGKGQILASIGYRSDSTESSGKTENSDTSIGIGYNRFYSKYSPEIQPYLTTGLEYRMGSQSGVSESSNSGVFYHVGVGIRFALGRSFFFNLESLFFENALISTTKTGDEESSVTTIGVNSEGDLSSLKVGLGMIL